MPLQLSQKSGVQEVIFGWACISERPALAPMVAQTIATWAFVECTLIGIAAEFLTADVLVATAMLQSIENQTTQRLAIVGAAREALTKEDFCLFEASLNSTNSSRKTRNNFAHHLWGLSPQLPDALLLLDPKDHIRASAESKHVFAQRATKNIYEPMPGLDRARVYVWTDRDLNAAADAALRAKHIIDLLRGMATWRFAPDGPAESKRQ